VSSVVYGPDETWPDHQKPYWNVALKQARAAGWSLTTGGHWFGVASCPSGEHTFGVDKTARGGETKALEVPKLLRSCQHGTPTTSGSKVAARRAECERMLTRAEELISIATADLRLAEQQQEAFAELDNLSVVLETAAATVNEVLAAAQDEALDRAAELEDAPDPVDIQTTLGEAEHSASNAAELAGKIRRPGVAGPLLARANAAKASIGALREGLATL
jgi:hypothetical protein